MPYDEIESLRDKLNSLPLTIQLKGNNTETIVQHKQVSKLSFTVEVDDFNKSDFNCYISGLGKQKKLNGKTRITSLYILTVTYLRVGFVVIVQRLV